MCPHTVQESKVLGNGLNGFVNILSPLGMLLFKHSKRTHSINAIGPDPVNRAMQNTKSTMVHIYAMTDFNNHPTLSILSD